MARGHAHGHHHHSSQMTPANAGPMNMHSGRAQQVLRLWAEVFHVSASSGAARWNQISDDLVPITVTYVNGKFHLTAFNIRTEKVFDTWLTCSRLAQASNCFVYWKDNVSLLFFFISYLITQSSISSPTDIW